jgi:hypothetical protein
MSSSSRRRTLRWSPSAASCGVVEFDFDRFVGNKHNKLHKLATVTLTGPARMAISSSSTCRSRSTGSSATGWEIWYQGGFRAAPDRRHRDLQLSAQSDVLKPPRRAVDYRDAGLAALIHGAG